MRRTITMRTASVAFALVAATLTAKTARAQFPTVPPEGFALDRFDPSERGSEWFVLDSLDFRGTGRPAAGVVAEWAHNPLVVYDAMGNQKSSLVGDQLFLHPGASLVLGGSLRVGIDAPIAVADSGSDSAVSGTKFVAPTHASFGDVRVSADVRILGAYGEPFSLAAGMALYVPTGEPKQFTGDGLARGMPRLIAAGDIGMIAYSAKLGWMITGRNENFAGAQLGNQIVYAASVGARLLDRRLLVGPELYGLTGVSNSEVFFSKQTTPGELLLGGHYMVDKDWRVGAGFGPGLGEGYGSPAWRAVLSAEWVPAYVPPPPPVADRDQDGISDDRDMCPDRPGPKVPGEPLVNGCPPDRDKDGVADSEDACPDVPGVRTSDPKTNGCPPDKDGDGIIDAEDACPDVPGVKTDDPKTNGCPPDRDHDGVADNEDACPDTPGVKTNDPKTNGCPPPDPDRDKDGIKNEEDACPDVPGEKTEDPKTNGCPKALIVGGEIKINEQVKFKFDSAEILKDSDELLTAVAKILTDHPELQTVRVEGHTDNIGKAAHNKKLSEQRAAAVVAWLVKHGVDKKRLKSQGFGADKPIDSNADENGRKNNRRVEFHIEKEGDANTPPPAKPEPKAAKPPPAPKKVDAKPAPPPPAPKKADAKPAPPPPAPKKPAPPKKP